MASGKYKRRITVQQASEARDGAGEPIITWSTYIARTARVRNVGGSESFAGAADADISRDIREFIIRWDSLAKAITTKMRVSYDSKVFDIKRVRDLDDARREVELLCERATG